VLVEVGSKTVPVTCMLYLIPARLEECTLFVNYVISVKNNITLFIFSI
jgi:hypothetical protein